MSAMRVYKALAELNDALKEHGVETMPTLYFREEDEERMKGVLREVLVDSRMVLAGFPMAIGVAA